MSALQTYWSDEVIAYDGSQLRAHWLLDRFGLVGDALCAFRGPCNVAYEEVADLEDLDGPGIAADDMLQQLAPSSDVSRTGDDLYVGLGKLSISIATVSPVSALMHFAVNAQLGGAPVAIASLNELALECREFAHAVLARVREEQASITAARAKVRAKGEWR